jgi:type II secretory pathway pseudopilin PulG
MTLIETLVYITLFALVSTALVGVLVSMSGNLRDARLSRALLTSGSQAIEQIIREGRKATTIDVSSSLGTNPSTLVLTGTHADTTPYTIEFGVGGGALTVTRDSSLLGSLTGGVINVDDFTVTQLSTSSSSAFRVVLTLSATLGSHSQSATWYGTAVLRGGY